jgi:hypothetical protein
MRGSLTIVVVVTTGLLLSSRGSAQSEPQLPAQYLSVKLGLSIGGSLSAHSDARTLKASEDDMPVQLAPIDRDNGLKSASPLAEVAYLFSAHRFFALGPLLGLHSWRSEAGSALGESSSFGVDLGLVLQPRLPLGKRFELYVSIPLSLTLSILNEYKAWTELQYGDRGAAESVDPTYGWGVGVLVGARYAITSSVGLLLELGWQRYAFTHEVQYRLSSVLDPMGSGSSLDLELATSQFRVNAGVFF